VNNSTILILIFVYCTYSTAGAIVQISPVVSEYGQYVITTSFETWKKKHFRWIIFIFIKKKMCVYCTYSKTGIGKISSAESQGRH